MTEHTEEPWRVVRGSIFGAGDDLVLGSEYGHLSDEDIRRIVACVNALAGIPDGVLAVIARIPNRKDAVYTLIGALTALSEDL